MAPILSRIVQSFGSGSSLDRKRRLGGVVIRHVEILFTQFNDTYAAANNSTSDSPTLVLTPDIQYLYVLGTGGGGGGGWALGSDDGRGGGGGAGSIRYLTGYQIPGPNRGSPIQVKVGDGGKAGYSGGATSILLNGGTVFQMNYGSSTPNTTGGAGGSVTAPGLTRLPAFPSNFESTGGSGGNAAQRRGSTSQNGGGGANGGCGGGGGGGAHVSNKPAGNGGGSGPNTNTYNIVQENVKLTSFANPYPITINGTGGGAATGANGPGIVTPGGDVGLALGGSGNGQDFNTGSSAGAGAGLRVQTPNSPSATYRGGGGGGIRGYIAPPSSQDVLRGWGGGGFIIVIGSSYELVSGVDY